MCISQGGLCVLLRYNMGELENAEYFSGLPGRTGRVVPELISPPPQP